LLERGSVGPDVEARIARTEIRGWASGFVPCPAEDKVLIEHGRAEQSIESDFLGLIQTAS